MKTKETESKDSILGRITALEQSLDQLMIVNAETQRICSQARELKPVRGEPHGPTLEVDMQTKRQMAAQAQFLNLHSPDELAQIVLHAFLEMCDEDHWIKFPLMLQQVETV